MIGLFAGLVIFAGIVLMLAGAFGIWLAMASPIQLQPLPLIALILGLILIACGASLGATP